MPFSSVKIRCVYVEWRYDHLYSGHNYKLTDTHRYRTAQTVLTIYVQCITSWKAGAAACELEVIGRD